MIEDSPKHIVLASRSPVRARLLRKAGLDIIVSPAGVDEEAVKNALIHEQASPAQIAQTLAELKTVRSARHGAHFVIGADQVLSCDGTLFNKPDCLEAAREHLIALRGKTHILSTAVCIAKGGGIIWRYQDTAELHIRSFTGDFLDTYLFKNKERVLESAGGYFLESDGVQLFDWIKGDYFSILGLPLIPILNFLREHGVLQL